jgi:hypothetical protein
MLDPSDIVQPTNIINGRSFCGSLGQRTNCITEASSSTLKESIPTDPEVSPWDSLDRQQLVDLILMQRDQMQIYKG